MQTRDQILNLARSLLIDCGYNGFSYANISRELNIKNAAVHYHFPSKADLGLRLIEPCSEPIGPRLNLKDWTKPSKCLRAYLNAIKQPNSPLSDLRLIGALTADFERLGAAIQAATRAALENHQTWLADHLKAGRKRRDFDFSGKPRNEAMRIMAMVLGAQQASRPLSGGILADIVGSIAEDLAL